MVLNWRLTVQPRIEQLATRPELLSTVANWIYNEWWSEVDGANIDSLIELLKAHLIPGGMPITLVASLESHPVGTATLLAHDIETEEWPELSPWLAALYVVPECRHRGIGTAVVNATIARATALGVGVIYLSTLGREEFYGHLGWQVVDRKNDKIVMSKTRDHSHR